MKFFAFLFAEDGDRTAIPNVTQPSGEVSYEEGFGPEYELLQTDPDKRNIERRKTNQVLYDLTLNSKQYHTNGFPEFISPGDTGDGNPYPYSFAACVRYNGYAGPGIYYSLVDANVANPSDNTKWVLFNPTPSIWRTGDVKQTERTDLETGWIWRNGLTIGNADSNATNRANVDTYNLFVLRWTTKPNAVAPVFNSDGTAGIRGVSADADWNANKAIAVADQRGRVAAGHDAMGGAPAAGRLTGDGFANGVNGGQIGASGGTEMVQLEANQNGPHQHVTPWRATTILADGGPNYSIGNNGIGQNPSTAFPNGPTYSSVQGQGAPHNNTQPTIVDNFMVKL